MASIGSDDGSTVSLNIMPMLDIFSILILFLLMNFSTDPMNHDVEDGLELPESLTLRSLDELPSISVSKTDIKVNDKSVGSISKGIVDQSMISQGALLPVFKELKKISNANKRFNDKRGEDFIHQAITIEMDKSHSFGLMKMLMKSAEQADFVKFKLMVSKEIQ